jgi:diacylglycerol kinase (ATP)
MRTVVFINTHSRRASRSISVVRKFFAKQRHFDVIEFIIVEDLRKFDQCIKQLKAHKNIDCVVIGGGDGTLMAVFNALKQRKELVYGLLPLGTSNVFARNIGLPINLHKALEIIAQNHVRHANLGSVNGVLFTSAADIGLSVEVVKQINNRVKRHLGPLAYYLIALKILHRFKPFEAELLIDNTQKAIRSYDLAVITGRYFGPVTITKQGSVFNDRFTILYGTNPSRFGFVKDVNSFALGRQHKRPHVFMLSAKQVTIKTKHAEDVQADGEIVSKTPAKLKIVKNAIRVLAPAEK